MTSRAHTFDRTLLMRRLFPAAIRHPVGRPGLEACDATNTQSQVHDSFLSFTTLPYERDTLPSQPISQTGSSSTGLTFEGTREKKKPKVPL